MVVLLNTDTDNTVCPRSSDPFYIVSYYIKWVTTSWTYSISMSTKTTKTQDGGYI